MSIRVKHKVRVQVYREASEYNGYYVPDDTRSEVVLDSFDRQANSVIAIGQGTSETLDFGDVDAVKGIYLEVDQDVTVSINGSVTPLQLRVGASGGKAKLFLEADITSVEVTAPSGADVVGECCVWGDVSA